MGSKDEDGERPKARDPKEIGVTGTREACMKAKVMIQKIEDEWVSQSSHASTLVFADLAFQKQKSAPRPPRDGGGTGMTPMPNGSGFGGGFQAMPAMPEGGGEQSAPADGNAALPLW